MVASPGRIEARAAIVRSRGSEPFDQAKPLGDRQGVVVHGERRIPEMAAHLGAVPEAFMPSTPGRDRLVSLPLVDRMGEIDITEPEDPNVSCLYHCDWLVIRVHDDTALPDLGERLVVVLVFDE